MAANVFVILGLSCLCLIEAQKDGFSVELILHDSIKSLFYDPLEATSDRLVNALHRSFNHVHHYMPNSVKTKAAEADLIVDSGAYLINISLGTPSFGIVAIADTGSDLIWTQCKPCSKCFKQHAPIFNPHKSSTYKRTSCCARQCKNLQGSSCSIHNSCQYSVFYGDSSFSGGSIAADTLTLALTTGRPIVVPNIVIGCGHNNSGSFVDKISGIIGLVQGEHSLFSKLGTSIAGKFSYCLLPCSRTWKSSKMNFGSNAMVSGLGVVSTPMAKPSPNNTYYLVTLEAISVGTKRIKFTGTSFGSENGSKIIDSGTTLTLLPTELYLQLESAMSSQINAAKIEVPKGYNLLCYDARNDIEIPDVTVHFTDVDVKLKPLNTFVKLSDTVRCFSFSSVEDFAIYGNLYRLIF